MPRSNTGTPHSTTSDHETPRPERPQVEQAEASPRTEGRVGVSTIQVGASALAAVTAALAASFFGVAGTIAGAAFGSVVTTVAAALYARSLRTAEQTLRRTGSVVVARVPAAVTRQPDALPRSVLRPDASADADAQPRPGKSGRGIRWTRRRTVVASGLGLAGIAASGFALAVAGLTAAEGVLGHPVSGGGGGTSFGRLVDGGSRSGTPAPSRTPSAPSPSATATPTVTTSGTSTASNSPAPSPSGSLTRSTGGTSPSVSSEPSASAAPPPVTAAPTAPATP